jgi:hypothetical protein
MFFETKVSLEPFLTIVLPEFKECSKYLSSNGLTHELSCSVYNWVLHCYAHLTATDAYACQYYIVTESFNFI